MDLRETYPDGSFGKVEFDNVTMSLRGTNHPYEQPALDFATFVAGRSGYHVSGSIVFHSEEIDRLVALEVTDGKMRTRLKELRNSDERNTFPWKLSRRMTTR